MEKNNLIHDIREGWTEEEWNKYYQVLAEAEEELEEKLTYGPLRKAEQ